GFRLTAGAGVAAFGGVVLADARLPARRRLAAAGAMAAGAGLALLPCFLLAGASPRRYWFGNFQYPALNTAYRMAQGHVSSVTPAGKVLFAARLALVPGNLLLLTAVAAALVLAGRTVGLRRHPFRPEMTFLGLLVLFLSVRS